jgi:hypothetical protein
LLVSNSPCPGALKLSLLSIQLDDSVNRFGFVP